MRTRKKAKFIDNEQRGGRRSNAGRKCLGEKKLSVGIYIRCTPEQKEKLEEFAVQEMNSTLSTWIREIALESAGIEK